MKPTGKINPITGDEILTAESFDVPWEKTWDELTDEDKVMFLSYKRIGFLSPDNEFMVMGAYLRERKINLKNT